MTKRQIIFLSLPVIIVTSCIGLLYVVLNYQSWEYWYQSYHLLKQVRSEGGRFDTIVKQFTIPDDKLLYTEIHAPALTIATGTLDTLGPCIYGRAISVFGSDQDFNEIIDKIRSYAGEKWRFDVGIETQDPYHMSGSPYPHLTSHDNKARISIVPSSAFNSRDVAINIEQSWEGYSTIYALRLYYVSPATSECALWEQ